MSDLTDEQRAVRAAFLEKREPQSIEVAHRGHVLEVRQPSIRDRGEIFAAAMASGDLKKLDVERLQVKSIVVCSYFPGTDQRAFTVDDEPLLARQLVGGAIDRLATAAAKLVCVDQAQVDKFAARAMRELRRAGQK